MSDSIRSSAPRRSREQLREDAVAIWHAAVAAVRSDRLVAEALRVEDDWLLIGDDEIDLSAVDRIAVVGAGKAGAGMAAAVEQQLGRQRMERHRLTGWVNVPADCVRPLSRITLHAGRPAGSNEPVEQGALGATRILQLVESLGPRDLCLCLISGGGSALLPAPIDGVSLADKLAVTRHLSAVGADIRELNTVRQQLSAIKGGGLLRRCRAGRLVSLIISDVLGDPLDLIASGPTVAAKSTPDDALAVLRKYRSREAGVAVTVFEALERRSAQSVDRRPHCVATNRIIGNNARAVDAAGMEAERRGYSHAMTAATAPEGTAEEVGRRHAQLTLDMLTRRGPDCLITGGEPVVQLADASIRGRGGRNQQLALAAAELLANHDGAVLLSGGTDGEDGPTNAAGAWIDAAKLHEAESLGLDPTDALRRNDAYPFFEQIGALLKTGPTHTNVCDVRVAVVERIELDNPR